ncbi:MAG: helix-turn-helix domain-containing protein [Chthoniobacterales bacterium]
MFVYANKCRNPKGSCYQRAQGLPFWTFGILFKGSARIGCGEETFLLEAGHLLLVEANTSYRTEALAACSEIHAFFVPRLEIERLLNWPNPAPGFHLVKYAGTTAAKTIVEACEEMLRDSRSPFPNRDIYAEHALERALLAADRLNANRQTALVDKRIRATLSYIDREYLDAGITVGKMAKRVFLSPSRFGHLFRTEIGIGPMEFVERRRLQEAQKMLVSMNETVAHIGELCGFKDQFHFSRRFKKFSGQSPREYRLHPAVMASPSA